MSEENKVVQANMYQGAYRFEPDEEPTPDDLATPTGDPKPVTPPADPDLSPEEKTYRGRYENLKGHHDKTVRELRDRLATLEKQLNKSSREQGLPTTQEDLAAWAQEYPDVFAKIKTLVRLELNEDRKEIDQRFEQVELLTRQARRDKAEAALLRLHPDVMELRNDENFHKWVKEQPEQIKAWLYDNEDDPLLAARAIDLYKADTGYRRKKKDDVDPAKAALSVGGKGQVAEPGADGKKIWKASEIRRLTPRQFEAVEAEIDLAGREGRIVNDM